MIRIFKKLYELSEDEKPYIRHSIITGLLYSFFNLFQFAAIYLVLKAVTETTDQNIALQAFGIMLVSVAGSIVMHSQSNIKQMRAGLYMAADKRIEIGDKLRYAAMGYFNDNSLGRITAAVSSKLYLVENTAPNLLSTVLQGLLYTLVLLIGLTCFQWKVGLAMFAVAIIYICIIWAMFRATKQVAPRRQQAVTKLTEGVLEYIQGIAIIRSFQNDNNRVEEKMRKTLEESRNSEMSYEKQILYFATVGKLVIKCGLVGGIAISIALYSNGDLAVYEAALAVIGMYVIFSQLEVAGSLITVLQNVDTALDEIEESANPALMESGNLEFDGKNCNMSIRNVSFSYGNKKVLEDINVEIPQKAVTAIVGYSGSGKSTLCSLIYRFWDVDSGSIEIGGHDIREYQVDQLMENISIVFQKVYLFHDTIANNIKFGRPDATKEEIIEAAKRACCHDFIMELPDQYDTVIGENGATLSGGEKQRISIARAIIKDAPIVILDEATSNIDPENEKKIQRAIDELTRNKTIIMIAHKLKTVRNADQILVMDSGRIQDIGTHTELLKSSKIYSSFVNTRAEANGWKLSETISN